MWAILWISLQWQMQRHENNILNNSSHASLCNDDGVIHRALNACSLCPTKNAFRSISVWCCKKKDAIRDNNNGSSNEKRAAHIRICWLFRSRNFPKPFIMHFLLLACALCTHIYTEYFVTSQSRLAPFHLCDLWMFLTNSSSHFNSILND